jgi:hypothetical protein
MPTEVGKVEPNRVLGIRTVEEYMTVNHKVWEKQMEGGGGTDLSPGYYMRKTVPPPTGGARVATLSLYIRKEADAANTPLPFYLLSNDPLPPHRVLCGN